MYTYYKSENSLFLHHIPNMLLSTSNIQGFSVNSSMFKSNQNLVQTHIRAVWSFRGGQ